MWRREERQDKSVKKRRKTGKKMWRREGKPDENVGKKRKTDQNSKDIKKNTEKRKTG